MSRPDVLIGSGVFTTVVTAYIAPLITVLVGIATLIYTVIRLWETKTVQRWVNARRS